MTYGDLYDEMLNECIKTCPTCERYGGARILKELDPIAYRCGFSDWLDSVANSMMCKCGNDVGPDIVYDSGKEDEVKCAVCKGLAVECDGCHEITAMDNATWLQDEEIHLCLECVKERKEDEEDE